jgi:hypothetical protein
MLIAEICAFPLPKHYQGHYREQAEFFFLEIVERDHGVEAKP